MRLIFRALGDPAFEQFLLRGGERAIRLGRRHQLVGVGGKDVLHQLALLRFARHERLRLQRLRAHIQPQVGLALIRVLAVAVKAVLGQDRPDVAVELDFGRGRRRARRALREGGAGEENDGGEKEEAFHRENTGDALGALFFVSGTAAAARKGMGFFCIALSDCGGRCGFRTVSIPASPALGTGAGTVCPRTGVWTFFAVVQLAACAAAKVAGAVRRPRRFLGLPILTPHGASLLRAGGTQEISRW